MPNSDRVHILLYSTSTPYVAHILGVFATRELALETEAAASKVLPTGSFWIEERLVQTSPANLFQVESGALAKPYCPVDHAATITVNG